MADPAPPPPLSSLLGLPTEIKAHIVKLAKQGDENLRLRLEKANETEKAASQPLLNGWYGKSTSVLRLVNKELSELASDHVFEDLRVSGCRSADLRQYETLLFNSHRSRHLVLDLEATLVELAYIIPILLHSPSFGIKRMTIHGAAAAKLFGNDAVDLSPIATPDGVDRALDFCLLARSITNLSLLDVPFQTGALLLPRFPHLRQLSLHGHRTFDSTDENSAFLVALTASASLEHLTMDNSQRSDDGRRLARLPDAWDAIDWVAPASFKVLVIDIGGGLLEQRDWRFVKGTSASLENLTLVTDGFQRTTRRPLSPLQPSLVSTPAISSGFPTRSPRYSPRSPSPPSPPSLSASN